MSNLNLEVNGQAVQLQVDAARLLVEVLREQLGLTGTHVGCDTSQCGACTVLLDGQPVKSCSDAGAAGRGPARHQRRGPGARRRALHPIQQAFIDCHGLQCGFCTPGMIMSTAGAAAAHAATPARSRSSTRWRATCAAAPATSTSSPRCKQAAATLASGAAK